MATGDKAVIAIANRDSLKYKVDRQYGTGSIVLKDGMFYEANGEVPSGTTFAEGSTGATWKVVGGIPDWVQANPYTTGARVFHNSILWEANGNIPANTTFSEGTTGATWRAIGKNPFTPEFSTSVFYKTGDRVIHEGHEWEYTSASASSGEFSTTKWTRKIGLVDGKYFGSVKTISNATTGVELNGDYVLPETADTLNLGDLAKPLACTYAQRYRFSVGGTYLGEIDADSNNLEINSPQPIQFKPSDTTKTILKLTDTVATLDADLYIPNHQGLRFQDSDSTGKEYWDMRMTGNDWRMNYNGSTSIGLLFDRLGSDTTKGIFQPLGDGIVYCGSSGKRWIRVYSQDSTISTSDVRLKNIHNESLPASLLESWAKHCTIKDWSWKKDGQDATRKFGWIAQDIIKAFDEAGVDWRKYSLIEQDEDGFYHICKDECQAVENALIRYKLGI